MMQQDKKLKQLLQYADDGFSIFPLKPNQKTPMTANGHKDATTDKQKIKEWYKKYPKANWGVATGKVSGFFVIDIDVKKDKKGLESWKQLKKPFHKLYSTLRCDTTTGGRHYYFSQPDNTRIGCIIGLMDGVDIKGDGGYVVIPPSTIDGVDYEWNHPVREIADAPAPLLTLLKRGKKVMPPLGVKEGERNQAVFKYALDLVRYHLPRNEAEGLVLLMAEGSEPPFDKEEALRCLNSAYNYKRDYKGNSEEDYEPVTLKTISVEALVEMDIPERQWIAYPAIAQQGLSMLCARRGVGKTQLATELAYGAALGASCLGGRFKVDKPFKTLYVDGEMPARSLQDRFIRISKGHGGKMPAPDYLRIITPDLQEKGIPDLAMPQGQDAIESVLGDIDFLILDNLSSLCRRGKENESESWLPIQEWVLKLRSKGTAIMFVHHAGKKGDARGTSRREDVLDTVISLKQPHDYKASQGARFTVKYEKSREVHGEQVEEFELWLKTDGETSIWETPQVNQAKTSLEEQIIELHMQGKSLREIEEALGVVGKTKVGEVVKEWQRKNREDSEDEAE